MQTIRLRRPCAVALILMSALLVWAPSTVVNAADSFADLRAAILAANSGSGAIALSGGIVLTAPLPPITGSLTIDGGGHSISGDGQHRIFDVSGGRLTLNNMTVTAGRAPEEEDGGAIRMRNGGALVAQNVAFTNNSANFGGAIRMSGSYARLTVRGSSFSGNRAREYAGAIYAIGEATISGSSFVDNSSSDTGGALVAASGRLQVFNSTFQGNRAQYNGGAIFVFGGDVTLTHVTMTGNRLSSGYSYAGSALAKQANNADEGPVRLRNSIVDGDGAHPDCAGGLDQYVGNLSTDGTCSLKASDNPLLDALTGSPGYRPLRDRSPAVDAGDPAFCLETDQIGTARPQGEGCDIGAIESTTARPPEKLAVPPPPCPLADQIIAANTDAPSGGCRAGSGHDTIVLVADIELSEDLPIIRSEITIEGKGYAISGGRSFRIFDIDRGKLRVNDLTLTHSVGDGFGGAIRLQNGSQAIINNSRFITNISSSGGAIGLMFNNYVSVNNSTFVGNRAAHLGGAISINGGGTVEIRNSSFADNSSSYRGGAIGAYSGRVSVSNSSFFSNQARDGGGGALFAGGAAAVTLTHVTLLNNEAAPGSAIHIERPQRGNRVALNLRNSVIAGIDKRGTALCWGRLTQNIGSLIEDASCASQLQGDPLLEEATDTATFAAPLAGSPLVDAAHPDLCDDTDQIGQRRPLGGGCDIGAIETVPLIQALSACRVKTTHTLNFRDGPFGERIGSVPASATLVVMARTAGWFNVEYEGAAGWISADYVEMEGGCDLE